MPQIFLYAEILTHIRQLTLHASILAAKKDAKLDVSVDKKVITVTHEGETQRLYLPTQISGTAQVGFPTERKTEVSARVQIEDEHEWKCIINHEIEAPWMAADLSGTTAIHCRQCEANIMPSGKVSQWKDLPSENWAELMDFWFCHKPHEAGQSNAEAAATAKGFSSQSKLAMAPGTGMTDLVAIVLHSEDCSNVKAAEQQKKPDATVLRCSKCLAMLGTTNEDEDLFRLHKSSITIDESGTLGIYDKFASTIFTCAQILSLIESTALKRFVVYSTESVTGEDASQSTPEPLILWIFNPDIYYSCSTHPGNGLPSNGMAPASSGEGATPNPESNGQATAESQGPLDANPNNDDISGIYGGGLPTTDTMQSPAASLDQPARQPTPSNIQPQPQQNDDTTQLCGQTDGPQLISGEVELELPVQQRVQDQTNSTFEDIPVETIEETETPLITSKTASTSTHPAETPQATDSTEAKTQTLPVREAKADPQPPTAVNNEYINLVHRAAKIFYKPLPADTSAITFLDQPSNANTHEPLYLPNPADLAVLRKTLEDSTAMLPASARTFQDWNVGLLDRYEKVPSGLGVMAENPLARGISAKDGRVTRWDLGNGAEGLFT